MKIMGQTKNGFIIETTREEIANLIGFYSDYSEGYKRPSIGDVIQISKMYQRLHEQERRAKELATTARTLRTVADLLEPLNPVIKALSEDEKLEQEPMGGAGR